MSSNMELYEMSNSSNSMQLFKGLISVSVAQLLKVTRRSNGNDCRVEMSQRLQHCVISRYSRATQPRRAVKLSMRSISESARLTNCLQHAMGLRSASCSQPKSLSTRNSAKSPRSRMSVKCSQRSKCNTCILVHWAKAMTLCIWRLALSCNSSTRKWPALSTWSTRSSSSSEVRERLMPGCTARTSAQSVRHNAGNCTRSAQGNPTDTSFSGRPPNQPFPPGLHIGSPGDGAHTHQENQ
mmetsp:Transcript_9922/g.21038  ORF Transcript_9922/g.21038 Transcript_9922/m.21038 type:complete len:239 (+) Transcript_9922:840-1556(+)